ATTYRGLLGGLQRRGHQIEFFERDAEWYACHRDLPEPPQAQLRLYPNWDAIRAQALASALAADVVVVGSYFPDAIPLLDAILGHGRAPICFYDIDTPVTLAQLRLGRCAYLRADHIPALDLYLSFTGGPVLSELKEAWGARQVRPLYCACDERDYLPASRPAHPAMALSFMGTFAPDRRRKLEQLFLEPARRLPRLRFHLAGSMYPQSQLWPPNVRHDPHLPPGRHREFYASSRLTLNLTRQAMVEAGYSPSVRLFEAAAAATALVSDPWPGLTDFFQPGAEILIASSAAEMVEAVQGTSDAEAARLGRAAQARVLAAHTGFHRAAALEGYLAELGRSAPSNA
ncbi:MAG: CgeB family protein, partial [Terriglobales bacterium]